MGLSWLRRVGLSRCHVWVAVGWSVPPECADQRAAAYHDTTVRIVRPSMPTCAPALLGRDRRRALEAQRAQEQSEWRFEADSGEQRLSAVCAL